MPKKLINWPSEHQQLAGVNEFLVLQVVKAKHNRNAFENFLGELGIPVARDTLVFVAHEPRFVVFPHVETLCQFSRELTGFHAPLLLAVAFDELEVDLLGHHRQRGFFEIRRLAGK